MKLVLKDSPPSNSHAYKLGAQKVETLRATGSELENQIAILEPIQTDYTVSQEECEMVRSNSSYNRKDSEKMIKIEGRIQKLVTIKEMRQTLQEMEEINEIVKQQFETVQDLDWSRSTMKQTSTAREEAQIYQTIEQLKMNATDKIRVWFGNSHIINSILEYQALKLMQNGCIPTDFKRVYLKLS